MRILLLSTPPRRRDPGGDTGSVNPAIQLGIAGSRHSDAQAHPGCFKNLHCHQPLCRALLET